MQIQTDKLSLYFFSAIFLSSLLTPIFRLIALRFNILDVPSQGHKTHSSPIPYLGGASVISTTLILSFLFATEYRIFSQNYLFYLVVLVIPSCLAVIGLFDDLRNTDFKVRLFLQFSLSLFSAFLLTRFGLLGEPSGFLELDYLVTVLWLVGIPNAFNFLDNLDGSAAGVAVISAASLGIVAIVGGQNLIATLAFVLSGSTLGFLFWNLNPARIYLGDFGSLFIGALMAILILQLEPPSVNQSPFASWFFGISLMAIPILDTTLVVCSRIRRGVSIFQGGRDHISHRLIALGWTRRNVAFLIWATVSVYCVIGFYIIQSYELVSLALMVFFCASWIGLLLFFLFLEVRSEHMEPNQKY